MAGIQTPIIISIANQKGGVGKSTLSVCFANYLVSKGVRCKIVDCDRQQSISKRRKRDIEKYGNTMIPYAVESQPEIDIEILGSILSKAFEDNNNEVVIFDCPGGMPAKWEISLINNSDVIIIPFQYENLTLASTTEFIVYVTKIFDKYKKQNPGHIFMVPNTSDKRIGTLAELRMWDTVREKYSSVGTVTPKIYRQADMTRISTLANIFAQLKSTSEAFDRIYRLMFGTTTEIREPIPTLVVREPSKRKKKTEDTEEPETVETDDSEQNTTEEGNKE